MKRADLVMTAVRELEHLHASGSPVAGSSASHRQAVALFAIRRVDSFARRGLATATLEQKAADLAKGLVAEFEGSIQLAGPLKIDYAFVSERLLKVIGG